MVRINGRRAVKGDPVGEDDRVEVTAPTAPLRALAPNFELPLEVLFKDEAVLVVNKPGGLPCHPLRPGERDTVMNAVVAAFPEVAMAGPQPLEGGLVHRLDNGTSGALLIAREPEALRTLRSGLKGGQIRRAYLALVAGELKQTLEITEPLAHHPRNRAKMVVARPGRDAAPASKGRPAHTRVSPLDCVGAVTLVSVVPATGCRHQIRVHLASVGLPIVGDELYGGPPHPALAPGRFWLHLSELAFTSPASGPMNVTAPLPADLGSFRNAP